MFSERARGAGRRRGEGRPRGVLDDVVLAGEVLAGGLDEGRRPGVAAQRLRDLEPREEVAAAEPRDARGLLVLGLDLGRLRFRGFRLGLRPRRAAGLLARVSLLTGVASVLTVTLVGLLALRVVAAGRARFSALGVFFLAIFFKNLAMVVGRAASLGADRNVRIFEGLNGFDPEQARPN